MKRSIYILLLILIPVDLSIAEEAFVFSSISEAFESRMSYKGMLPAQAAEYIAQTAGLSWEAERPRPDMGKDIRGYVSPNYEYCILSFAHFGEWGQGGEAEYCLIDSTGVIYWRKTSTIVSGPAVSNRGLAALFGRLDRPTRENRKIDLLIININGDTLLNYSVEHLLLKPFQRSELREDYGFSNDGMLFYSTFNIESDDPPVVKGRVQEDYQHSTVFTFDARGSSHYTHYLGFFNPQKISNIRASDVIIHGDWILSRDPARYDKGHIIIKNRGSTIEKRVTSTPSMFREGKY